MPRLEQVDEDHYKVRPALDGIPQADMDKYFDRPHRRLGRDVLGAFRQKLKDLSASIDEWESVTKDVNFPPE